MLKSVCERVKVKRSELAWIKVKIMSSLGENLYLFPVPQRAQVNEVSKMEGHKLELPGENYLAHPSFRKC
jgi:hypothetical protein